jgi:hypothetical protein
MGSEPPLFWRLSRQGKGLEGYVLALGLEPQLYT